VSVHGYARNMNRNRQVSIIVPNLNSVLIDRTIDSLLEQTAFDQVKEILVIGMDEPGLVSERGPVRSIPTERPVTAPVARNMGMQAARGDLLAFIDADCVADPGWLDGLLDAHAAGHVIVGGSVALAGGSYWQLCYNLTMFHEFLPMLPPGIKANLGTLNLCVDRQVVTEVGLMDETLARGQDTEWTFRMRHHGYTLWFTPSALVHHFPDVSTLGAILRVWCRSGFFNSQVRLRYRDICETLPFQDRPLLLRTLSPFVGAAVTARIFARNTRLWRYAHAIPVVFLTKVAWCWGASQASCGPVR
jgi:glycosyltransferase involved in cell wall biosynthesis